MWSVVSSRTCRLGPLVSAAMVAAFAAGCGDRAARVELVPLGGDCGRPAGANEVTVTAYGSNGKKAASVGLDEAVAIGSFPADTEQFAVEVSGGGVVAAEGKSAPLVFNALPDGSKIYVLMAAPDGFCELPPMAEARSQPLVAPAGNGALVVGGIGPSGPLSTAEYYDPTTATFQPVDVPPALADDQGFAGAALATFPDGQVALVGGPAHGFVVFDPVKKAFAPEPAVIERRAFHAAIAIGEQEVLVAGGCTGVTNGQCSGVPRLQTERYQLGMLGEPVFSAVLAGQRVSAQLFDLGVQLDGARRYLLAGGVGAGGADRFALDDTTAQVVPGGHAQPAALDGGAVLTAFADDAAAPDRAASVYAPGAAAAAGIAPASAALSGVRLVALEDGRVLGFGGGDDLMGDVLSYDPTHDAWRVADPATQGAQTGSLSAPSLARLADGTVLVLGGAMSPRAWLYRPSLVGPASPSVAVVPANDDAGGVLTAPDPATVTRTASPAAWQLTAPSDDALAMARALVGGPRMAVGSVFATVHVLTGGVALIARQTGPGDALVAELTPGSPPQLVRRDGGGEQVLCSGSAALAPFDPTAPAALRLTLTDHDAQLILDGGELLRCDLAAADRGAWGIASLGASARLIVDTITVTREPPAT
jgi:hypothetical protein